MRAVLDSPTTAIGAIFSDYFNSQNLSSFGDFEDDLFPDFGSSALIPEEFADIEPNQGQNSQHDDSG